MTLKEYAEKKESYETMTVGGKIVHCMNETKHGLKKDLTSSIIGLLFE